MRQIELFEILFALTALVQKLYVEHLVHAVMPDSAGLLTVLPVRAVRHEIIVLIVPHETPRAGLVPLPAAAQLHLLVCVPLEVLETDLAVRSDGVVQPVDVVVYALVHRLDATCYEDLPLQLLRVMPAGERLDLTDQLVRLAVRHELCGLHRIDEKLQLRQLEVAGADVVVPLAALLLADYIEAEGPELLEIHIQSLPVGINPAGVELAYDLRHRQRMLLIRLLHEYLHQIEKFQFLIRSLGHDFTLSILTKYTVSVSL